MMVGRVAWPLSRRSKASSRRCGKAVTAYSWEAAMALWLLGCALLDDEEEDEEDDEEAA